MTYNPAEHRSDDAVWAPCGTCWGQRMLFTPAEHGRLVPSVCPSCMGIGERLTGGGHVPAATP
jgi:hypothetical protein